MKKIIMIILVVVLALSGAMLLKKRKHAVAEEPVAPPVQHTVRGVMSETREVVQLMPVLARLESKNLGKISSKLTAQVVAVAVLETQEVEKGELLIRLDDRDIQAGYAAQKARLTAARSRLDYTRALYKRNQALFAAGGLSREKLQESEVVVAVAVADVRELEENIRSTKAQLDYAQIRAPFAGTVGSIAIRAGELVSPGRVILTLNSLDQKLTFTFAPSATIRQGQEVFRDTIPIGIISKVYTEARGGLWIAEIGLTQPISQPSGTNLTVGVEIGRETGCAVPVQSLLHRQDHVSVMEYEADHFHEKKVEVTVLGRDYALIQPCSTVPVAVAAESKLVVLPTYGQVNLITGENHE